MMFPEKKIWQNLGLTPHPLANPGSVPVATYFEHIVIKFIAAGIRVLNL